MTNQVPFNWDADLGPTDDAGLLELMEKQAKEAGEYPDWYYDGEPTICPVQTSFSWWKPSQEEDISNRSWDEACGAYIDD